MFSPENAHHLALEVVRLGLAPRGRVAGGGGDHAVDMTVEIGSNGQGRKLIFDSPIGLAAGFDKNGEAIEGLFDLGFSYVEIGR